MKKTRKSHFTPPIHSLSMEEMGAYIEDRLSPTDRQHVDAFLAENPLYRETLMVLQESYEVGMFEEMKEMEQDFSVALNKEIEKIRPNASSAADPMVPGGSDVLPMGIALQTSAPQQTPTTPSSQPWYAASWVKMAASLVLIAGLGVVFLGERLFTSEAVKLAEQSLVHYDPNVTMSGTNEEAIGMYNAQKYQEAIPLLQKALQEGPNQNLGAKLSMYLGVSYSQLDQLERAIPHFKEVLNTPNPYALDARWYLALIYTRLEDNEQAKSHLEFIRGFSPKNRRQGELIKKATELLELIS